jgi:hypothetical protein
VRKNLENYFGLVGGWRVCSVIVAGVKGGIPSMLIRGSRLGIGEIDDCLLEIVVFHLSFSLPVSVKLKS